MDAPDGGKAVSETVSETAHRVAELEDGLVAGALRWLLDSD
jgi:hypothetical protein